MTERQPQDTSPRDVQPGTIDFRWFIRVEEVQHPQHVSASRMEWRDVTEITLVVEYGNPQTGDMGPFFRKTITKYGHNVPPAELQRCKKLLAEWCDTFTPMAQQALRDMNESLRSEFGVTRSDPNQSAPNPAR